MTRLFHSHAGMMRRQTTATWQHAGDGSSNSSLAIIFVNCNNGPSMRVQKILHSHATPKILAGV
jgi:hypothetical protein